MLLRIPELPGREADARSQPAVASCVEKFTPKPATVFPQRPRGAQIREFDWQGRRRRIELIMCDG